MHSAATAPLKPKEGLNGAPVGTAWGGGARDSSDNLPSVPTMTFPFQDLLRGTSRSFYLTLRVLPGGVRPQISLAYLLARTADTIADTEIVPLEQRLDALRGLRQRILGERSTPLQLREFAERQGSSAEKLLLERAEDAVAALQSSPAADRQLIQEVLNVITSGQELDLKRFPSKAAGRSEIVALQTDAELDEYTYLVAGCVGEFWTKLSRAHLFPRVRMDDQQFMADGVRFGKGLQLVNVLRDLPVDLQNGRCYLPMEQLRPAGLLPASLLAPGNEAKFLALYRGYLDVAEAHLRAGWRYTNAVPYSQFRVRLACAWPILIGARTIAKLRAASVADLQKHVKVSRAEVRGIMARSALALALPFVWRRLLA